MSLFILYLMHGKSPFYPRQVDAPQKKVVLSSILHWNQEVLTWLVHKDHQRGSSVEM